MQSARLWIGVLATLALGVAGAPGEDAANSGWFIPWVTGRYTAFSDGSTVDRDGGLWTINAGLTDMIQRQDPVGYIRTNLEFHRTLYLRAQAPAMLAIAETVWLQLGPTMRAVYSRIVRSEPPQHHRMIIAALKAGDEPALRLAVRTDVTQGLRHLLS